MISCSSDYKNAINMNSLTVRSKIVVDNVEYLSNVIKTAPKISHKATSICGCFPTKTVDFELYDFNNEIDLKDKEVIIYKGVMVNNEIEYIQQGIFIPRDENIETNISTKTISIKGARDKSQLFDDLYSTGLDWTSQHTGLEIIQEICERRGITLKTSNFSFYNYLFYQPNFTEDTTDREAIARMAEIGGEQAFIDYSGQLVIRGQTDTEMVKERKSYTSISEEGTITINRVILSRKDRNDDIIYPTSIVGEEQALKIIDNPYVDLHREAMIEDVASHVIGLTYMPYTLNGFIDGFIYELNDVFYVNDRNNNTARIVAQNIINTTRIKSEYSLEDMKKTITEHKIAGGNSQELAKVRLDVNHIENEITSIVSDVENLDTTVGNNYQTLDDKFSNYVPQSNFVTLENSVTTLQTNTYSKTEINTKLTDGSVTKVQTMSGTFDENGMHYEKTNAKAKSTINENGVEVDSTSDNSELLFAGYDATTNQSIVRTENLTVRKYLVIGNNSRIEDFENGGGIFVL